MSIFMQYEGINGEVSNTEHQNWIDVQALSWGTARQLTSNSSTRGNRESSNAQVTELVIRRLMDKATPHLFLAACCGKGKEMVLHLTKTGTEKGSDVYMAYTLKNALLSGYKVRCTRKSARRPTESITVSFTAIQVRYTPYDDAGQPLGPLTMGFDMASNEKV